MPIYTKVKTARKTIPASGCGLRTDLGELHWGCGFCPSTASCGLRTVLGELHSDMFWTSSNGSCGLRTVLGELHSSSSCDQARSCCGLRTVLGELHSWDTTCRLGGRQLRCGLRTDLGELHSVRHSVNLPPTTVVDCGQSLVSYTPLGHNTGGSVAGLSCGLRTVLGELHYSRHLRKPSLVRNSCGLRTVLGELHSIGTMITSHCTRLPLWIADSPW